MKLVLIDKSNYKEAIKVQNKIFPKENGALNILASLDRELFMQTTGLDYVDDGVKYYLAYVDDKCVGITGMYHYDEDDVWLGWFGVLEEYRCHGYGREILNETINLTKELGFKNMRLYTDFIDNSTAIILYEKMGFVGEKYTAEQLPYDCRIYSKSLIDDKVDMWNNRNLNLSYQTSLDHMDNDKINEIVKMYEDIMR